MVRAIVLLLLCSVSVFGQRTTFAPFMAGITKAAAAGGSPSGPPVFVAGVTNKGTVVSSLSGTLNPSGANIAMVWFEDWYSATRTPNTPTWKGSSTGVTLWTNGVWYDDGNGKWRVYILLNPSTGSGSAATSWSGTVDEAGLYVAWFTNCSSYESAGFNFRQTVGTISAKSPSQTKDLQLFYSQSGSAPNTPTAGSGQTIRATNHIADGTHMSVVTTKAGEANTADVIIHWDSAATGALDNTKLTTVTKGSYGGYVDRSPYSRWSIVAGSNSYSWNRPVVVDGVSYTGAGANWAFGDEGAASAANWFEMSVVNGSENTITNIALAGFGVFALTNSTGVDAALDLWSILPGSGGSWAMWQMTIANGTSTDVMKAHSDLSGASQGSAGFTVTKRKVYYMVEYVNLTGGVLTNYLYDPDSSFSLASSQTTSVGPATAQGTIQFKVGYLSQIPGFMMLGDQVVLYDPTAQQVSDLSTFSAGGYTSGFGTSQVTWGTDNKAGAFSGSLIGF